MAWKYIVRREGIEVHSEGGYPTEEVARASGNEYRAMVMKPLSPEITPTYSVETVLDNAER
jgi:hypothetical protein